MTLFQMSLIASPLILVIILARQLFLYQLPKRTFKILWMLVIVRLFFPHTLPSRFSIFNLFPMLNRPQLIISYSADAALPSLSTKTFFPFTITPWNILWLIGCLTVAFFFLQTHIKNRMKFIDSDKIEHPNLTLWFQANRIRRPMRIRFSNSISSPLAYGVFMPVILLPKDTNLENELQLHFILTHEYIHLCRFDALIKAALAITLCIHWFNPLIWIMFILATRDIELTCDEGVLRTLGYTKREAYAYLLINMSASQASSTSIINHFSDNALEERVFAIMKMKKKKVAPILLGLLLCIGIFTVFATDEKRFVYEFIAEADLNDTTSKHLNQIRRFCYDETHDPSNLFRKKSVVSSNKAAVKEYEEAIPDLVSSGLVSEKAAEENLKNLKQMLKGAPVDFYGLPPYIYFQSQNKRENTRIYVIQLNNGDLNTPYYYSLPIEIVD